jgi:hypothetical protein
MMTGENSLSSHNVMKLFLEAGAKTCFVNKANMSLVECLLNSRHSIIVDRSFRIKMKDAFIIFNSHCFNFALMDSFNWSVTFGGFKVFVKEALIA